MMPPRVEYSPTPGDRVIVKGGEPGWASGKRGEVVREALPDHPGWWTVQLDNGSKFLGRPFELTPTSPKSDKG